VIAAIICGFFFFSEVLVAQEEILEYTEIQEQFTAATSASEIDKSNDHDNESDDTNPPIWVGLPYAVVDFEALLQVNPDTVGWIAIPNTPISYPVVQTVNNLKYLNTSFTGEHTRTGTPFIDQYNTIQTLDTNTIIYGHNMGTGRDDMFSSLLEYKEYDYFVKNKYIQFDTIYKNYGWWEVFAFIEYDVRSSDFQFLQIRFNNNEQNTDWIKRVKELSLHDTDMIIYPHDNILTLSTCDRSKYGRYGRVLILAVHISAFG
jgi:sortase B